MLRLALSCLAALALLPSAAAQDALGAFEWYTIAGVQPLQGGTLSGAEMGFSPGPELLVSGLNASGAILTQLYSAGEETFTVDRGDTLYALSFNPVTQSLEQVWRSSSAWYDFDGDGDRDLVMMGARGREPALSPVTAVYVNDRGRLAPTPASARLPALYDGALAAGDLFGDGRAYVAMTGLDAQGTLRLTVARLYSTIDRTSGLRSLDAEVWFTGAFGRSLPALALGDCDGDGDLDLALSGLDDARRADVRLYRNTGSGFAEVPQNLPGVYNGGLAFGDVDGDGDADLVVTGAQYGPALLEGFTALYRSQDCTLTPDAAALPPLAGNTAVLADHDADGDLDLLLNGLSGDPRAPSAVLAVYNNDGAGGFRLYDQREGALYSNAYWIDLNNDQRLDPIVVGSVFGTTVLRFYRKAGPPVVD